LINARDAAKTTYNTAVTAVVNASKTLKRLKRAEDILCGRSPDWPDLIDWPD